jgi:hypothetical protein
MQPCPAWCDGFVGFDELEQGEEGLDGSESWGLFEGYEERDVCAERVDGTRRCRVFQVQPHVPRVDRSMSSVM